MGDKKLMSNDL